MKDGLNVVVVLGKCARLGTWFGIRFEEKGEGHWVGDWAFPIKETSAKRERFDEGEIAGSFAFAPEYPGCPACGVLCVFRCSCGKVGCWDGTSMRVRCPSCGESGRLEGVAGQLSTRFDG